MKLLIVILSLLSNLYAQKCGLSWEYQDMNEYIFKTPTIDAEGLNNTPIYGVFRDKGDYFQEIENDKFTIKGKVTEEGEPGMYLPILFVDDIGNRYLVLTNKLGEYEIDVDMNVDIAITLEPGENQRIRQNYNPSNYFITLISDTNNIDFEIVDRQKNINKRLSGIVTMDDEPLNDVEILVRSNSFFGKFNPPVKTDDDGYYITNYIDDFLLEVSIDDSFLSPNYKVYPEKYEIDIFNYEEDIIDLNFEIKSISSVSENIVEVYPNPTNEIINIDIESPTKIELFNIFGDKLLEDYNTKLNISHLSRGTYYIRFLSQTKMVVKI